MQQVHEVGLEGLSINKLAHALDYTPGALYRYFPSKDALVLTLIEEVVADVSAELVSSVDGLEPLEQIRACIAVWTRFAHTSPERFGLIASTFSVARAFLSADIVAEQAIGSMMKGLGPLRHALSKASDAGLLSEGDPIDRTLVLFASVNGLLMLRKQAQRAPGLVDIDRLIATLVETLLLGWAPELPSTQKSSRRTP